MSRFRATVSLFALVFGLAAVSWCRAQSNAQTFSGNYVCLQYPVYYDGMEYLFVGDDYNATCTGDPIEENYYWVDANEVPSTLPQNCVGCFAPGALGAVQPKQGVVQAKAEDNSAADIPFPEISKTQRLLPSTFKFGNDNANQPLPAIGPNGEFKPSAGIKLISSQWVRVTAKDGKTIAVKLFTAQIDYAAAGITNAPQKTKIIRLGFEMAPPKELATAPTIKPIQKWKDAKYNGEVKLAVDNDTFTYRIVTQTPLF